MKRIFIISILIIGIITWHNFIFASYSNETFEQELFEQVKQVFYQRTRIWNNLLAGQYTTLLQVEEELGDIITNPLLELDMKLFRQILDSPTSYEGISSISIKDICIIKNSFKRVDLEIVVLWEIEGYENNYNEEIKYSAQMEKIKEKWLLSDYKIIK